MDVAVWLQGLGRSLRDSKIDWEVLRKLTSQDLKEIGLLAIGHRRQC